MYSSRKPDSWFGTISVAVLFAVGVGQGIVQAARQAVGSPSLWNDAANVWVPVAEAVASGTPLYLGAATDNKPPGFMLLNQVVYATDHYAVVFFVLVGLANALGACLLYYWLARSGRPVSGALAGLLFLAALPAINGTIINVRSFALVAVLGAVLTTNPWLRGALLGVSGMVVQYAAFAIPMLLFDGLRRRRDRLRYAAVFCASGLTVVAIGFAMVFIIWGTDSLVGALENSFLVVGQYSTNNDVLNPLTTPVQWAEKLFFAGERLVHLLVPAVGLGGAGFAGRTQLDRDERIAVGLALSFAAALFIKSLLYYWTLVVPFLAVLTATAAGRLYSHGLTAEGHEANYEASQASHEREDSRSRAGATSESHTDGSGD